MSGVDEKIKYDPEYISYVEHGDSAAVFIVRDVVEAIDTRGKWIDVLETLGEKNYDFRWDFKWIRVEIFPRKTRPKYPKGAAEAR